MLTMLPISLLANQNTNKNVANWDELFIKDPATHNVQEFIVSLPDCLFLEHSIPSNAAALLRNRHF